MEHRSVEQANQRQITFGGADEVSSPGTQLESRGTAEPKPKLHVLLVGDDPLDAELVLRALGACCQA